MKCQLLIFRYFSYFDWKTISDLKGFVYRIDHSCIETFSQHQKDLDALERVNKLILKFLASQKFLVRKNVMSHIFGETEF